MKSTWFALGVALAALLLGGCAEPSVQQRLLLESHQEGIHVVGTAIARAAPDVALVEVGHAAGAAQATTARAQVDDVMKKVIALAKEKGMAAEEIQTVQYTLGATFDKDGRRTGWRMVNIVRLRIKPVDLAGEVIDAAVTAGATIVRNIAYTIEDVEKLRSQARDEAVGAAKAKAEQMAKALGVEVGKPIVITETAPYYQTAAKYDAAAASEAPADWGGEIVSAGQVTASLSVEVTFEIK